MTIPDVDYLAQSLAKKSRKHFYNHFEQTSPEYSLVGEWCMPPDMLSIYGLPEYDSLGNDVCKLVSFYEIINLFSVTAHGEKILVSELSRRLYGGESHWTTEYLHHFIDEENKHMLMFSRFCTVSAGFLYPDTLINQKHAGDWVYEAGEADFMWLLKVVLFEMLIDWYNVAISNDERVATAVRDINRLHHQDEARHLAFGRALIKQYLLEWRPAWSEVAINRIRNGIIDFIETLLASLWNKQVYIDAGIDHATALRAAAYASDQALSQRQRATEKCLLFLRELELIEVPKPGPQFAPI